MLKRLMVILAAMAMVASACGSDSDDASGGGDSTAATTAAPAAPAATEAPAPAAAADSSDAIKLPIHNWSSQIAGVYAVGAILEATGNSVEYISADSTLVYTSMCEGDMDLVHEVWEGAFGVAFMEQVDAGCVIDAATHDAKTREDWWYPSYVEDVCPGLPDWEALNDCASLFATPDSGGKGRFLGGPVDWLKGDQERVEGLEMDFIVENAGTAGALWAALDAASVNQEPVVIFNWTPNFVEAMYEGSFIEFPEFADECRTDASWGLNPETTHDCGNPKNGYLKLGVWSGFPDKWPTAYAAVQKMNFTNLDIAQLAMYVDIDGMEPEDAAALWLADNCARWTGWASADASACPAAPEMAADSSDAIKLPIHNWSSQIAGVYAIGAILEATGNSVEYISADSTLVYTSMCEGDMDLVHEVWEGAFGVAFMEQVDAGCVIDAATHDAKTREDWWYPSYVEDVCPGLPDWEALNDCASLFATPDSGGKGRFLGGPVDWLKGDQERVEGLEMDFIVENAGTAGALWAALDAASVNQEPVVIFNWTPNFVEAMYDGSFIEFPEFADECRTDASWGLNPETTHDCGNPKNGYLKLGVWSGFPDKWPNAYKVVQKMNLTNLDVAQLAMYVDIDGMEPEDAAALWLADNCARWTGWASVDASACPEAPAVSTEDLLASFDANGDGTITIGVAAAGPRDDNGYYQSVVNFAEAFSAENGFAAPIVSDNIGPAEAAQALSDLAQQGVDILLVGASEIAEPLADLTEQFPDIFWYCNCGAGFQELPGLAQAVDWGAPIHYTAGVAMGAVLKEQGSTQAVFLGCCDINFERESYLGTVAGLQSVDESFTMEYVGTGDYPYDFDNSANATAALTNAQANGATLAYAYLGGALEPVGQLATELGMAVFAAGPADICSRDDGISWTGTVIFDGGRYASQAIRQVVDGTLGEGSTLTFGTLPGLNGGELCDASAESQALLDAAFVAVQTDGELLGVLGGISGEAYSGG